MPAIFLAIQLVHSEQWHSIFKLKTILCSLGKSCETQTLHLRFAVFY